MSHYQRELAVAQEAVRAAEVVINTFFRADAGADAGANPGADMNVRAKADNSPVTDADVQAEEIIKEILLKAFPQYGFYGEETDRSDLHAEYLWLVDPIDGTKSFVRHSPFFSTQVALMHKGKIVVGVSNGPAMNELAYAVTGGGGWVNGVTASTSGINRLSGSYLSAGNISTLAGDAGQWTRYGDLVRSVARVRGYGDFYHYHQLASGQADVIVESDVNILDIAALSLIVTEAGGVFTDLAGKSIDLATTSVLATATPELHEQVLVRMQSSNCS